MWKTECKIISDINSKALELKINKVLNKEEGWELQPVQAQDGSYTATLTRKVVEIGDGQGAPIDILRRQLPEEGWEFTARTERAEATKDNVKAVVFTDSTDALRYYVYVTPDDDYDTMFEGDGDTLDEALLDLQERIHQTLVPALKALLELDKEKLTKKLPLREQIAGRCHEMWSTWMRYLFENCIDGTIPQRASDRWARQMDTSYGNLPQEEKESNRKEADEIIAVLTAMR